MASIKYALHFKLLLEGVEFKQIERNFLSTAMQLMYLDICLSLFTHRMDCFRVFFCDKPTLEFI